METIRDYLKIARITGTIKYLIIIVSVSTLCGAFMGFEFSLLVLFTGMIIIFSVGMTSFHPKNIKIYPIKNSNISGFYFAFIFVSVILSTGVIVLISLIFSKEINFCVFLLCIMMMLFYLNIDFYFIIRSSLKSGGAFKSFFIFAVAIIIIIESASLGFIFGYSDGFAETAANTQTADMNRNILILGAVFCVGAILTYIILPDKIKKIIMN